MNIINLSKEEINFLKKYATLIKNSEGNWYRMDFVFKSNKNKTYNLYAPNEKLPADVEYLLNNDI